MLAHEVGTIIGRNLSARNHPEGHASPSELVVHPKDIGSRCATRELDSEELPSRRLRMRDCRPGRMCPASIPTLRTRNGFDATRWFPEIVAGLAMVPGGPHVVDGELCVQDEIGRSDFDKLQERALAPALQARCPSSCLLRVRHSRDGWCRCHGSAAGRTKGAAGGFACLQA